MANMASMLMRVNRHASAASRAARLAAAAASRAARLAAADASPATRSATNAASLAAAVAAAASRSAANAASRATRSDSGGPTHSWKRRDDSDEPLPFQGEYVPGKDVTYKDIESDEAIWALYERWCKAFNKERDHTEMARRFKKFKSTVHFLLDWNKAFREQCKLGEFADGEDE